MRLGVARALVDGVVVAGDVEVDPDGRDGGGGGAAGRAVGRRRHRGGRAGGPAGQRLRRGGVPPGRPGGVRGGRRFAGRPRGGGGPAHVLLLARSRTTSVRWAGWPRCGPTRRPGAGSWGRTWRGPFLSPAWAGAHLTGYFRAPDPVEVRHLLSAGPVRCMTVAPELAGALDLVAQLAAAGVLVSVGHTDADAAQVAAAVGAGARHLTHCWNAHRRFAPRDPGPAGVALSDPRVTVGPHRRTWSTSRPRSCALTLAAAARPRGRHHRRHPARRHRPGPSGRSTAVRWSSGTARPAWRTARWPAAWPRRTPCCGTWWAWGPRSTAAVDACGGAQRRLLGLAAGPAPARRPRRRGGARRRPAGRCRTVVAGREVWAASAA